MAATSLDFFRLAKTADPNVCGCAVLEDDLDQLNWFVVTRTDGVRVRLDTADGNDPTQAAIDAVMLADTSELATAAREQTELRNFAKLCLDARSPMFIFDRAILATAVAEINLLRSVITQMRDAVAASSGLAGLKAAIEAIPNLPPLTPVTITPELLANMDIN